MSKRIRTGFIGCGGNASSHIGRVLQIPEAEIVALCDPSKDSLARAKERNPGAQDVPEFTDYQKMLAEVELDAVQISTPHTLHFEQIMICLDKGLHVLTEKPMVCTVEHAHQVIAKARQVDRTLMIAYQRHLQPAYRFVRDKVKSGEMGDIQFVSALQDQRWYSGTKGLWRQQLALSGGGQLNDSGSHLLDIVLWMTGLGVTEVQAFLENFESEVDINSALTLKFSNGALGNLSIVGNSPVGGVWEDITIWGTKAVVYIRNGKITYKAADMDDVVEPEGLPEASTPDRNFYDAILGRDEVQVPPECGLRVIELTEAAWESARTGKPSRVHST
ncbi:MAG: Gfo/Idh/MocA family oxidoreductase [bacterium]|nr:Gfo/Idh/MocA family oxidoreductase [bacterium]